MGWEVGVTSHEAMVLSWDNEKILNLHCVEICSTLGIYEKQWKCTL